MLRKLIILCLTIYAVTVTAQKKAESFEFVSETANPYGGTDAPTTPAPLTTNAPTTVTSSPSTTSTTTTTTTTTPKPTSTTSHTTKTPPTTPKPFPSPIVGEWNTTCIMLKMAAQLNITYETKDNINRTGFLNVPKTAIVEDSTCNEHLQTITLQWGTEEDVNTLHFVFASGNNTYFLETISTEIQLIGDEFPNAKENASAHLTHIGNDFITPMKMSYHCSEEQDLNLTRLLTEKPDSSIKLTQLQLEAFSPGNITSFSTAQDCNPQIIPDAVPIVVGLALSLLILIVLISFLVARRRSNARGYMSF